MCKTCSRKFPWAFLFDPDIYFNIFIWNIIYSEFYFYFSNRNSLCMIVALHDSPVIHVDEAGKSYTLLPKTQTAAPPPNEQISVLMWILIGLLLSTLLYSSFVTCCYIRLMVTSVCWIIGSNPIQTWSWSVQKNDSSPNISAALPGKSIYSPRKKTSNNFLLCGIDDIIFAI